MIRRAAAAAVVLVLALGVTTACKPEPAPSPSGPVFANEEAAFAAAEETYRAYVDALNQVDLSDPETFEAVYAWTTGEANAGEKKSLSRMHADGWTVEGDTLITEVALDSYDSDRIPAVVLDICTDVSGVRVLDSSGQSVVAADRPEVQASVASFVESTSSSTGLVIASIEGGDQPC